MAQDDLENFGAYRKARELFDFVVEDMRAIEKIPACWRLIGQQVAIRGQPVSMRGRHHPIELLFNLEHPEQLAFVTEVNEDNGDEEEGLIEDEADSTEDELRNGSTR